VTGPAFSPSNTGLVLEVAQALCAHQDFQWERISPEGQRAYLGLAKAVVVVLTPQVDRLLQEAESAALGVSPHGRRRMW
jgi:hypothetical protein